MWNSKFWPGGLETSEISVSVNTEGFYCGGYNLIKERKRIKMKSKEGPKKRIGAANVKR